MKILVCVKRVVDYNVRIRVKADGSGVELAGVKMAMNPFDEIAVEEAVRLKERGVASEVVAVSIGENPVQETLRAALAIGADRAVHISTDALIQPLAAAKILREVALREQPNLILMGKQAIDDDCNQTPQMLAGLLGWGQGTFASKLEIIDGGAVVTREIDGGLQTLRLSLPCIVSADLRLNTPRYASLPNIMKAKSKPLTIIPLAELNVDVSPRLKLISVAEPTKRKAGIRVKDVPELLQKLREEAKVI